jgi:F-type H+-transporting ATPase subunit epsilon
MARTLMCEIVTPEHIVYTNEVEMVVAMTTTGEIGILPLHAPLVSVLAPGELRVKWNGGRETEWFAVRGGYIQIHEDKVIVLADDAIVTSQIDVERARSARELAQERLSELRSGGLVDGHVDVDEIEADLNWSELQLRMAQKTRD